MLPKTKQLIEHGADFSVGKTPKEYKAWIDDGCDVYFDGFGPTPEEAAADLEKNIE